MEKKYSDSLMRLKEEYPLTLKHLYQHPRKLLYSKQTR
jgi:hypothetical protein